MATTKPRITITLSTRQHEVLKSISECSGQPMSGFLNELLDLSLPTLERMAATFQKIKTAQDAQRQKIIAELDVAQTAMEPIVQSMTGNSTCLWQGSSRRRWARPYLPQAGRTHLPPHRGPPLLTGGTHPGRKNSGSPALARLRGQFGRRRF